ncbi:Aste57867_17032 [Aphanomyces stellatus]|uniref:Aste57867_17032 protein n=1 Tax=Aphanomyces stellatus TaxID=120398 RepID=A0A485L6U6_9STRA|nr:hypothetical protein As57867_016974 [Aphanomyces stellatus]VFT93793.1 Aste57867_17032 [Aphanomyces stellatus]
MPPGTLYQAYTNVPNQPGGAIYPMTSGLALQPALPLYASQPRSTMRSQEEVYNPRTLPSAHNNTGFVGGVLLGQDMAANQPPRRENGKGESGGYGVAGDTSFGGGWGDDGEGGGGKGGGDA